MKFGGVPTGDVVEEKVEKLNRSLEKDGYKGITHLRLFSYMFRTNEVMILVARIEDLFM